MTKFELLVTRCEFLAWKIANVLIAKDLDPYRWNALYGKYIENEVRDICYGNEDLMTDVNMIFLKFFTEMEWRVWFKEYDAMIREEAANGSFEDMLFIWRTDAFLEGIRGE